MINTDAFSKRLQKVIEYYGESASSFSEKVGVQRSTISHILSGRNKPSLDFVMKVLSHFPEVELYWLMNGKGKFPSEKIKEEKTYKTENVEKTKIVSESENENQNITNSKAISSSEKKIERIVIFYSDGSFQNFDNS